MAATNSKKVIILKVNEDSTMVGHSVHLHKVEGSSLAASGRIVRENMSEMVH
jgi:hypothetical protein